MTDSNVEVDEIISWLTDRLDKDLTLGKMFEVPREFIKFPNLEGEISMYDNLSPVDISMEDNYYVAQPTVWIAEVSLWGTGDNNIIRDRAPPRKSVIVVFREKGDPPVEKSVNDDIATKEWFVSLENSTILVLKLNEMGLYPLKSRRINVDGIDSQEVIGQFNLVE